MVGVALLTLSALAAFDSGLDRPRTDSAQSLLHEESPDVFLSKATSQQYLSCIVRRDWDEVKRLTHPTARPSAWSERNAAPRILVFSGSGTVGPGPVVIA